MNSTLWSSVVIGVLFSIVANLLTRPIQRRLDRVGRVRSLRRAARLREDYERVKAYHEDRQQFHDFVLLSLFDASVPTILALLSALGWTTIDGEVVRTAMLVVFGLSCYRAIKRLMDTGIVVGAVVDFQRYEQDMMRQIARATGSKDSSHASQIRHGEAS